jgi:hypothetical protein
MCGACKQKDSWRPPPNISLVMGLMIGTNTYQSLVQCIKSGLDVYLFPETLKGFERLIQAVEQMKSKK